jgi:L-seryl-tRNA(Ser) seleniumtransferase
VGAICADPAALALGRQFGDAAVTRTVRAVLADVRERLLSDAPLIPTVASLLDEVERRLADTARETLFGVINATGVVIHTNLGRAPLAPEAVAAMTLAAGYGNLELDLESGRRASRHDHLEALIAGATGAATGLAVNNCAGAVVLALAALAAGTPVIVSRGEMVEIGGGFRVPDIVAQSGARLVEIGTTNRTHLRDYEQAVADHPEARVILRTHPSNYRITGFTSAPSLEALAAFAHARGLLLVEDLGGGALIDLAPYGIEGEPRVQESVRAGADLVIFSGDKLMGGPQAGIIAGSRELVETLGRHPLARALRLDKLSLAALAATLRLYRAPSDPTLRVPVLRMLTQPGDVIRARAEALAAMVSDIGDLLGEVIETRSYAGGGAMPMHALPGYALSVQTPAMGAEALARRLRTGPAPVVGRIERDRVLLDLRTVNDGELDALSAALRRALAPG